ncbi:MAG: hypothetical protein AVDCRST_MAG77-2380 [uncultured Chloroflexi bacterium]|uniref:ABC transporter, substrate-binding protein (Cluster 1, maltose/g3p/polyamine/iron) n=1 Tax=uncultured Chloroflexota bacterium TaxID=166587 RepID=A0A6J4IN29_9CHLR|nr:MAG: hypothetical protein AVDCRST_MAG77-2380 [uncultured Chloroflexota bacterium]
MAGSRQGRTPHRSDRRTHTRRSVVGAAATVAGGAALAACGATQGAAPGGGGAASAGPVIISYMGRGRATEEEIYRGLIKDFTDKAPNVKVDIIWAGEGGADPFAEKLTSMLAGGTPPDTVWVHGNHTLDWAAQKVTADLTPYTKEKGFDLGAWYKGPVDDFRWENQLLALPRETSALVMFYNRSMFQANGVKEPTGDTTWAEWLDWSRKLTRDAEEGKVFGTFASAGSFNLFQMIWQNGGEIMNQQRTQSLLDSPAAIEAAQFAVDMRVRHRVSPTPADYGTQSLNQFMMGGRLATNTTNQAFALDLQRSKPFDWDAAPVPKNKVKAYAQASSAHGVVRASKQPAAGWQLVSWLSGEEASRVYAQKGLVVPAVVKVTEAEVFNGAGMPANYGKTWREVLKLARSFSVTRHWGEVRTTFDAELAPALDGKKSVPDAMRSAKEAIDRILASTAQAR